MAAAGKKPLFPSQPVVRLLLYGMTDKLRAAGSGKLGDTPLFASEVRFLVAIARPTNKSERDLLQVLKTIVRGLDMETEGRRLVRSLAAGLRDIKAPRASKKKGVPRAKRR